MNFLTLQALQKLIGHHQYTIKDGKLFFINPPADFSATQHLDPANKKGWSNWRKSNFEFIKKYLDQQNASRILCDIGAGSMPFREAMERFQVVGVDFFPFESVQVVADINQGLPFKDESFDIILLSNVLEHISNPSLLLGECQRILKNGGFLIGVVPFFIKIHQAPYDFHRYTRNMLEYIFDKQKFSKYEVEELGSAYDMYATIQNWFFYNLETTRVNIISKLFIKIIHKIDILLSFLSRPFYRLAKSNPDWPQGYGFIAYK